MPSLLALALSLAALLVLAAVIALATLLYLFTPLPPSPHPSESTYLSPSSPSTPRPLPSLLSPADRERGPTVALSVVVPAYNEAERLERMLRPALEWLEAREVPSSLVDDEKREKRPAETSYEVLIVDDGSRDSTVETALRLAGEIARGLPGGELRRGEVKVCRLVRNRGKGGATKHGVLHTSGARILFVDADGATTFSDLSLLEAELSALERAQAARGVPEGERHGLVVGSRAHLVKSEAVVKRSALRNLLMRSFHLYLSLLGLSTIRDTQCGFKLQSRASASLLYPTLHSPGWIFDCELLLSALRCGVPVREVGVRWQEVEGSKLDVVRDSVRMARDLLVIRGNYMTGRWKAPGRVGELGFEKVRKEPVAKKGKEAKKEL
ncbi:hypothetical protein JCM10207_004730 [Rhodosporidiobolus poonsookiae]